MSTLDVVDSHVYWQHPRFPNPKAPWSRTEWTITNTPMVNEPDRCTVTQLARSAVAGKPYIVSEVNHPFPNEYAAEGIVTLAAYAALQDWDGIFWYTYGHEALDKSSASHVVGYFDIHADPVKMAQIAVGALIYLRRDVRPAEQLVSVRYTPEEVLDSLRIIADEKENFNWIRGLSPRLPLVHRLRVDTFGAARPTRDYPRIEHTERIVSDTGELTWDISDTSRGFLSVDTARAQAFVGFLGGRMLAATNVQAHLQTPFGAIVLVSLDARPVAESARLLLLATARVGNTGMVWDEQRKSLGDRWGGPPTVIEPIIGRLELRGLAGASGVQVQALDAAGSSLGDPVSAVAAGRAWQIQLPVQSATVWYSISVSR